VKIITLKVIVDYLKVYKIRLLAFTLIGLAAGLSYTVFSPRIYEAYLDISLPRINEIRNGNFISSSVLIFPSTEDVSKFYKKPGNISPSLLSACSFVEDNNENRKALTAQIFSQNADPQKSRIAIRVQRPGGAAALACASELEKQIVAVSNEQKDYYLKNNPHNVGILNVNAAPAAAILVSDSYIYPRPLHVILGASIMGFLFSIFATWILSQLKKNVG
jgi:hypothetical protein